MLNLPLLFQRAWSLPFILLLSSATFADDGILVQSVPKGATKAQVLAIIQGAFVKRLWTVEKIDESSVTAGLSHRNYDCHVTISLFKNTLMYGDKCIETVSTGSAGIPNGQHYIGKRESPAPANWIANLRSDISQTLLAIPDTEQSKSIADHPSSVVDRLKVLQELRDSGLINEQEFTQKRQEIINSL